MSSTARRVIITAAVVAAVALVVGKLIGRRSQPSTAPARRTGTAANSMEYEVLGDGPKSLLFIQGGPGSELPTGWQARMRESRVAPYLEAGYTVWNVTRRRHMPPGHTIADMAGDYAEFIDAEMGGRVDIVVGQSTGAIIALYLGADHSERMRRLVLAQGAATITESGRDLDLKWATARAEGRYADAGEIFLEYVLKGPERAELRHRLGPIAGRLFARSPVPPGDLLVEAEAQVVFDARDALPRITVPVLMVCGDKDEFFPRAAIEETAALISDCTVNLVEGKTHMQLAMSDRIPKAILEWLASGTD